MWQEERQQKIRSLLAAYGQVSIDRIVEDFGVSRETIRRDFMEMELAGSCAGCAAGLYLLRARTRPLASA